jgi:hypothetical protein
MPGGFVIKAFSSVARAPLLTDLLFSHALAQDEADGQVDRHGANDPKETDRNNNDETRAEGEL